jgi:hypothetical protein
MKNLVLFLSILTCPLFFISCSDIQEEQSLFRNGTSCDSSYVGFNKNNEKVFYCYKNNTESYLITKSNGDTSYLKRYINPLFFEKLIYKKNELISASLNIQIKDLEGRDFANNVLNFKIKNRLIDKDSSFFYEMKDSLWFRINPKFKFREVLDSIWISEWEDYFPLYNQISDVKYPIKINKIENWIKLDTISMKDSVLTILLKFSLNDSLGSMAVEPRYFSNTIYHWNNEYLNRFKKNYTQH